MRRTGIAVAALIIMTGSASAQMSPLGLAIALRACQQITDDAARLECFDKMVDGPDKGSNSDASPDEWNIREEVSRVDDTKSTIATLLSEPENKERAAFAIACRGGQVSMWLVFSGRFFSADIAQVTYRLDDTPTQSTSMVASTNNRAYGLWDTRNATLFLNRVIGSRSFAVLVHDHDGARVEASFDISKIDAVHEQVVKRCSK